MDSTQETVQESMCPSCGSVRRAASIATPKLEATRKAIDEEIVLHYAKIDLLKAKRNAMAPISKLPNELMTRVITMFAVDSNALYNLKWIKVSGVCRHWRELALAAHSLWGYIEPKKDHVYYAQLMRSGAAPLSFKLEIYGDGYVRDIVEHSKRIRKLDLKGAAKAIYAVIRELVTQDFPIFSSLSLDLKERREKLPADFVQALPGPLFDGRIPLRKLKLAFTAVPLRLLSGLTTLSLTQCNDSSTGLPPDFGEVLDMFSSCPQLVSLDLDQISAPLAQRDYAVVHLRKLDRLRLEGGDGPIAALLHHLCFPSQTKLHLSLTSVQSGIDIRDILVPIRTLTRRHGTQMALRLYIDHGSERIYRSSEPSVISLSSIVATHSCEVSLTTHPPSEDGFRQILTKFLKAIPASVTDLNVRFSSVLTENSWTTIVPLLPALQTVYIHVNSTAIACLHALQQLESRNPTLQGFPRIRRLVVSDRQRPWWSLRTTSNSAVVGVLAGLEDYIKVRSDNGSPLETLEIKEDSWSSCHIGAYLQSLFSIKAAAGPQLFVKFIPGLAINCTVPATCSCFSATLDFPSLRHCAKLKHRLGTLVPRHFDAAHLTSDTALHVSASRTGCSPWALPPACVRVQRRRHLLVCFSACRHLLCPIRPAPTHATSDRPNSLCMRPSAGVFLHCCYSLRASAHQANPVVAHRILRMPLALVRCTPTPVSARCLARSYGIRQGAAAPILCIHFRCTFPIRPPHLFPTYLLGSCAGFPASCANRPRL
ncbi:F-box domain-containing protein [Mycena sanguinolenta]|uniref:F-box domain-containing protein n=1 Tax=Mycena sanguinolenta TaxID=230812 RepID=A0A8H7D386_9AGAR|nr:F-box domain-containing protein [Mycena sanguinolenta]